MPSEPHLIRIPWRSTIEDLPDGTKLLKLSINGRVELVLKYDPRVNTLTEQVNAAETKG